MRAIAKAHGVSVARVALAWVLAKPFVTTVIIGAKTLEQLDDNLEATELQLTRTRSRAGRGQRADPEYPGWMVERQNSTRIPPPK